MRNSKAKTRTVLSATITGMGTLSIAMRAAGHPFATAAVSSGRGMALARNVGDPDLADDFRARRMPRCLGLLAGTRTTPIPANVVMLRIGDGHTYCDHLASLPKQLKRPAQGHRPETPVSEARARRRHQHQPIDGRAAPAGVP